MEAKKKPVLVKFASQLLVAGGILLIFIIVRFGLNIVSVSGTSMEPTFYEGDILKYQDVPDIKEVSRGDVVLFKEDGKGKEIIKRVMALPGETILISDGKIYINGEVLSDFLYGEIVSEQFANDALVLASDEFFLIGDNYESSRDSRSFGPIKYEHLTGWLKTK